MASNKLPGVKYLASVVHYSRKDLIPQEAAYESDKEHKPPPEWPIRGAVEFKNVEMSYRPGLPNVLHGISLSINAGEKIGVVGRFVSHPGPKYSG